MAHHLVGVAEIARLLGVSRQRVDQLAAAADFPRPEVELAAGRIWSLEAIEGWLALHPERKPGRDMGSPIKYERFTDRARKVVALAHDEARTFNSALESDHLVLGLLREPEGVAGRALRASGLTLDRARGLLNPHRLEIDTQLPFTPGVRRALEEAEKASHELAHDYVGTEHLLLGLLRDSHGEARRLLMDAAIDLDGLRLKVLELLGIPQPQVDTPIGVLDQILTQVAELGERLARIEERLA